MAGISIGITSDVRDFLKGTGDIEQALDDVSDALDDVAADAKKDSAKIGRELSKETKDASKDAGKSLERVESSFKELAAGAKRETKQASEALSRNTKEGTSQARQDLEELGKEARQNAAETFSSFDGSAQSFADGIQGTLGGIVSELGPVGAAAGAAGALGIGLIMAAMENGQAESEEFKQSVADLATEFIETGDVGETSIGFIVDRLKELATETDGSKDSLEKLRKVADDSGTSFADLAQAYAGNGDGLKELIKKYKDLEQATQDANVAAQQAGKPLGDIQRRANGLAVLNDYLDQTKKKYDEAAEQERLFVESGGEALATKAAAIDSIQDSVDGAAGSWEDYQNKETGAIDPAAFLAGVQARLQASNDYASNLEAAQARLSPEAYQYLVDQGIDFAPMLAAILAGGDEMVNNFDSTFTAAAEAGKSAVEGTLPSEFGVTAKVDADTSEAESKTKATETKPRETTVKAKADTKDAEVKLDGLASKGRTATIGTSADTSGAASDLSAFLNRKRTLTITADIVTRTGQKVD
ncbi:hypothetical protein [Plantibacter sp. YIM 135249]|uniref:hypothetical protein n=1 Tax=Plantibacter sp. YIM 135249 TaxID=3423918 RepID=UPI003D347441